MFSSFLNDIELHLQADINAGITIDQLSIYLLLFADDAVLISESAEGLQSSMNNLFEYCTKWNITVNVEKTKIVIFHKGRLKKGYRWVYNNNPIEIVNNFNYLGIVVSSSGSFIQATNTLYL